MDDFDRLLALTRAAEGCNGLARQFIDRYGDEPVFSRFLSAKGQPYCQPAANSQAHGRLGYAEKESERLEDAIRRWDEAAEAHYFVEKAAADQRLPVLSFYGATYATAHEAARYFAEAVSSVLSRVEGDGDIEQCFDLARLLADFRPVPDYYGQIRRESTAAEEFLPFSKPLAEGDDSTLELVGVDEERQKRSSTWSAVHDLLDNEPGSDAWDDAKRRQKVAEWNSQYNVGLTVSKLGELIRGRRKRPKNDD